MFRVADGLTSQSVDLDCSLPQGSSLGPLKYVLYVSGLHELTGRFGVKMHSFADDTQLSKHLLVEDIDSGKRDMAAAIAAISSWSRSCRLKLNAEKSEVIWLGTRQQLLKLSATDKSLQLSDGQLSAAVTVRNLGVQIDEQMSFDSQSRSCAHTA